MGYRARFPACIQSARNNVFHISGFYKNKNNICELNTHITNSMYRETISSPAFSLPIKPSLDPANPGRAVHGPDYSWKRGAPSWQPRGRHLLGAHLEPSQIPVPGNVRAEPLGVTTPYLRGLNAGSLRVCLADLPHSHTQVNTPAPCGNPSRDWSVRNGTES